MKFRLMSDLHLEFQERISDFTPTPQPNDNETVLILAGDIATGKDAGMILHEEMGEKLTMFSTGYSCNL